MSRGWQSATSRTLEIQLVAGHWPTAVGDEGAWAREIALRCSLLPFSGLFYTSAVSCALGLEACLRTYWANAGTEAYVRYPGPSFPRRWESS